MCQHFSTARYASFVRWLHLNPPLRLLPEAWRVGVPEPEPSWLAQWLLGKDPSCLLPDSSTPSGYKHVVPMVTRTHGAAFYVETSDPTSPHLTHSPGSTQAIDPFITPTHSPPVSCVGGRSDSCGFFSRQDMQHKCCTCVRRVCNLNQRRR